MKCIILIHGFLTNIDDFKNIVPELENMYDHVELFVVPGHTIPPKYKEFKVKSTFQKLLETYDRLDDEYVTIDCIGFSMGGALATWLQSVRQINRLVLLAPANKYLNINLINNRIQFLTENRKQLKNNDENLDYKTNLDKLSADDKTAMAMAFKQLFPHYSIHNLSTFMSIIKRCNDELISITPPVLLIWGKLDQLVPESSIDFLYDIAINEKKRVIINNLSHLMLNSEVKDLVIKETLEFLKEE